MKLNVADNQIIVPLKDVSQLDSMQPLTQCYDQMFWHMNKAPFLFIAYRADERIILLVGEDNAANDITTMLEVMALIKQSLRGVDQILTLPQADVASVIVDIKAGLSGPGNTLTSSETPRAHQLFSETIVRAFEVGASDIHLYFYKSQNRAYASFKVNGEFLLSGRKSYTGFSDALKMLRATYEMYGDKEGGGDLDERSSQDTSFHYEVTMPDGTTRRAKFRLTKTVPGNGDLIYTVIRKLDNQLRTLAQLGITAEEIAIIRRHIQSEQGMVITSGPTGSGKSTTLTAGIREFPPTKAFQTIEDPVEIELALDHIVQNQLKGHDFATQMADALRQDIDGMSIGEVRNAQTLKLALAFAGSGHLCVTTTHANTPIGIIERLIMLGATSAELASPSMLTLLMGQRLEPTLCHSCKIGVTDDDTSALASLTALALPFEPDHYYRRNEQGCETCNDTGWIGRQLVLEMIQVGDSDRAFIRTADYSGWKDYLQSKGHLSLLDKSKLLVVQGEACPLSIESRYSSLLTG
jgi:type II secretory ATPase GspE/PulE/Tfp pilus assembly ATPase PilB-like protein